jgi:flagellar biosynthesis/type III secretory pathway protein FliH
MKLARFILEEASKMQWSNNSLLKGSAIDKSTTAKSIVTTRPIIPEKKEPEFNLTKNKTRAQQLSKEQRQLQQLEEMKAKILQEAHEEAKRIKQTALLEAAQIEQEAENVQIQAHQLGLAEGHEQGFQQGHEEGMKKVQEEAEHLFIQAKESLQEAIESSAIYVQEKRQEIIQLSVEMTQELIQTKLEIDNETILKIVEPILIKLEKPDQLIVIRANARYYDLLIEKMESRKQEIPFLRFLVLKDELMGPYYVSVESDEALVTFELEKELKRFLKQLIKE